MILDIKNHIYFGTYKLTDETILLNSLENAYKYGYTKIDTALLYKNQHIIGQFLNTPSLPSPPSPSNNTIHHHYQTHPLN